GKVTVRMVEQGADQVVLVIRVVADQAGHRACRFRKKQVRGEIHPVTQRDQYIALDPYLAKLHAIHPDQFLKRDTSPHSRVIRSRGTRLGKSPSRAIASATD